MLRTIALAAALTVAAGSAYAGCDVAAASDKMTKVSQAFSDAATNGSLQGEQVAAASQKMVDVGQLMSAQKYDEACEALDELAAEAGLKID